MSRKKFKEEESGGVPEYMLTYGDMMTLLLCFFVLLFAFSEIDARKFQAIMQSFQGSAGILKSGKSIEVDDYISNSLNEDNLTSSVDELANLRKLKQIVENYLVENDLENQILVSLEKRGLLLRFKENVLFDSGKAVLKPKSKATLKFLAGLLKRKEFADKFIRVEGHTDSDPIIRSTKYPTNWELSSIRAANVVRFFIEETNMKPERFSISGYSKYHPVAPNDTPENKAKNRRVDIVILRSDLLKNEPNY
ncbi:chemotaxis protein MotB [Caminicella sporogenes DSM 14501]|uniref:Chemotaxis protein MotB n=1 Tax=Caminicella sporogenes DSM 14501 TaxID=1121266 RepID=A0A1M6LBT1_9FIRM|nr:OmpA family protein [Caminicella sporogenes]RKD27779.1 flagellar motor protein MotB [Caminicella sporogenes]SHJ68666.1 chemotaxis protein MotB [Caminicella sporogenes DSM 14501]